MRETIAVTRFNQTTWNENCRWREKHNIEGCIYGTLQPICEKIHDNYKIYVNNVSMNCYELRTI